MPSRGVAPAQVHLAAITAAASRIPAPPREAGVTTHIPVPPRSMVAMETPIPAVILATAAMATAGPPITEPIRREATVPTAMADAMVAGGSMLLRSADRMARPTQRGFIVVQFGESRGTRASRDPLRNTNRDQGRTRCGRARLCR